MNISVSSFRAVQVLIGMLTSPPRQLCILACIGASGRHIRSSVLCAGLIAPCRAVFAVEARRKHARIHVIKTKAVLK